MTEFPTHEVSSVRRQPVVWVLALLLTVQGFSFAGAAYRLISASEAAWMVHLPWFGEVLPVSQTVGATASALAVLNLITALACFRLSSVVWLSATAAQGVTLLTLLLLYFNHFTDHLAGQEIYRYVFFLFMAFSVFLVFFLHLAVRRVVYRAPTSVALRRER